MYFFLNLFAFTYYLFTFSAQPIITLFFSHKNKTFSIARFYFPSYLHPIRIVQANPFEQPPNWLTSFIYPCPQTAPSIINQSLHLKHNLNHVSLLLETFQWLPPLFTIKVKLHTMTHETLYELTATSSVSLSYHSFFLQGSDPIASSYSVHNQSDFCLRARHLLFPQLETLLPRLQHCCLLLDTQVLGQLSPSQRHSLLSSQLSFSHHLVTYHTLKCSCVLFFIYSFVVSLSAEQNLGGRGLVCLLCSNPRVQVMLCTLQ